MSPDAQDLAQLTALAVEAEALFAKFDYLPGNSLRAKRAKLDHPTSARSTSPCRQAVTDLQPVGHRTAVTLPPQQVWPAPPRSAP